MASGGWGDRLRVDLSGKEGQAAVWTFPMNIGGSMVNAQQGASHLEVTSFKGHIELSNNVAGYDRGDADPRATELQRVGYSARYGADRTVLDVVTFAVPVVIGQAFDWGVFATLEAGASSYGASPSRSTAWADMALTYGGSAALSLGGAEVQGWTMVAASGIDGAAAPVPEPDTWALTLAGLGAIAAWSRRRWLARAG